MTVAAEASERRARRRIRVSGVVQGVGFRPFVHRLATGLDLGGQVGNDPQGVVVEVEGDASAVRAFESRLRSEAPPLAHIDTVDAVDVALLGERSFRIAASDPSGAPKTFVSPDIATCPACLAELLDPGDRRYRYPFVNCTNCGPRFTIICRLPYDRPNTTMRGFDLCADCALEYGDPLDRRFHAQPVACPACGPRLRFDGPAGSVAGTDASLAAAHAVLAGSGIVAVKGLGGYHLACVADRPGAVAELRRRKQRPDQPLAVMVRDLEEARRLAHLGPVEEALLSGSVRPIVLARRRAGAVLDPLVAPGAPDLGILLPYTPLHHLLFQPVPGRVEPAPRVLVMTSGNLHDEPICYDDADARRRLARLADGWLVHDRPIHVPCDDSVVVVDGPAELPVRRSRGYAPLPVRLPVEAGGVLATGGELKNTFCVAAGRHAWMSQHIGDMGSVETLAAFARSAEQFCGMYEVDVGQVAADAHPGYQVRQWADAGPVPVTEVQHHHAHIAAVMAEHRVPAGERVIGFAFDGTGYGTDGAIWGGEVLVAGYHGFQRAAHLEYVPLPGGDSAVRKPYRVALAHLWAAGVEWASDLPPVGAAPPAELPALRRVLERSAAGGGAGAAGSGGVRAGAGRPVGTVPTSSMGRLFDAVASLLGVRHTVSYEAQAAIEMEGWAAGHTGPVPTYRFPVDGKVIAAGPVIAAIVADRRAGRSVGEMAAGFHDAVAAMVTELAVDLAARTGLRRIALSGGVWQNVVLLRMTRARLSATGLELLTHRVVPPNDGGLALGQAVVAAAARAVRP